VGIPRTRGLPPEAEIIFEMSHQRMDERVLEIFVTVFWCCNPTKSLVFTRTSIQDLSNMLPGSQLVDKSIHVGGRGETGHGPN